MYAMKTRDVISCARFGVEVAQALVRPAGLVRPCRCCSITRLSSRGAGQ